jgi:DSF synthase
MSTYALEANNLETFDQLDVEWNEDEGTVWCYMTPEPRPCFTEQLLSEIARLPEQLDTFGICPSAAPARPWFLVYGSKVPGVFNLGGDLQLFRELIDSRDRVALEQYASACIDVSYQVSNGFGRPLTTISLIQGTALGGGMEGALAANVIVAERGVEMGLPEVLFNMFPGMGAYSFLSRRLGPTETERVILSGKTWKAEELHELGLIDIIAPAGEGADAVRDYISERRRRSPNTMLALQQVRKSINPVSYEELAEIAMIWVDAALRLNDRDLKIMERLVRSQNRAAASIAVAKTG